MKRYGSEICVALLLAVVISCFGGVIVYASSAEQQITDQMELTDLQSMVDEMLGEKTFSVTEAFHRLLSGEEVLSEESVREFLHNLLFYGIEREKELIVKLLLLLLFAAVFSGFAGAFDNGQVGEISFYVVYLLVFTLLMNSFSGLSASLLSMLAWITEFMKELSPVYFMAVAAASGASSAAAFYQGVLLLVWLFQWILEQVLLPAVSLYILLRFVNHLSREEMLGKMAELIETVISWGLRTLLGVAAGLQVVRGLVAPVMDSLKRSAVGKTAGALPGIGGAVNAVTELVLTTAVLVRNSLGIALLLVILAVGPILLRVGYELILLLVMQVKTTREIHQKLTQMTEERGPAAAPGRPQPAPETAAPAAEKSAVPCRENQAMSHCPACGTWYRAASDRCPVCGRQPEGKE